MSMWDFYLVGALFLIAHLGVSSTPARAHLIATIGENRYLLLYSVMAIGLLSYFVWIYSEVPRYQYLWLPNPDLYWLAKLMMPLSCVLLAGAFMVRNPSNVGESLSSEDDISEFVQGVVGITRHPLQWAIILWGISHLVANGDYASIFFFSIFILLSGFGTVLLDYKKSKQFGESWENYQLATSNVPFLALAQGRAKVQAKKLALPVLVGLLLYLMMYYFHELITGAIII